MSISRMSFNETPEWLNFIGFQVRVDIGFNPAARQIVVGKGSLVFGFSADGSAAHGFVVDNDMAFTLPPGISDETMYVTMDVDGNMNVLVGDFDNVRGIRGGVSEIPWYTFNGRALIGKVFFRGGFFQGAVACRDAFWCEFEGGF